MIVKAREPIYSKTDAGEGQKQVEVISWAGEKTDKEGNRGKTEKYPVNKENN